MIWITCELDDEGIEWGLGLREVPQDLSVICMRALGIFDKGKHGHENGKVGNQYGNWYT